MLLYPWNAASNVLRGNEHGRVGENAGRNGDPYRLRREEKLEIFGMMHSTTRKQEKEGEMNRENKKAQRPIRAVSFMRYAE